MSDQSTLTITGGPHGVVASLDDISAIKTVLKKVHNDLLLAASDTITACLGSYGLEDRSIRARISDTQAAEVKRKLETSRTAVLEGMERAINSASRPAEASITANTLVKALAEIIETYETAEREATPKSSFWEKLELYRNWVIGTAAGRQLSPLPGGAIGAKIGGPTIEGLGLYLKAKEGQRRGDKLVADVIRRNHPAIRQMLNELFSVKLFGVPNTTELAGGLARIDKAFNKLGPWENLDGIKVTSEAVPQMAGLRQLSDLMVFVDDAQAGGRRIDGKPSDETRHGFYLLRTTSAGGNTSWTVVIPGTSTWSPVIGPNHEDALSNFQAVGQIDTSLSRAIEESLDKSGVKTGDKVLLAGHSQGGIIAARLAKKLSENNRLNDMHLLTVGSPIAEYQLPATVRVLAVEHREDIVPALSGPKNPDGANWITVSREVSKGRGAIDVRNDLMAAHSSRVYAQTLDLLESGGSPQTDAWRSEINAVFASNSTTTATFYNVTRVAEPNRMAPENEDKDKSKNRLKNWRLPSICSTIVAPLPSLNNNCSPWLYPTRQ